MSSPAVSSMRKLPPRFNAVSSLAMFLNPLENACSAHSAADAHRDHSVSRAATLHFVKQRGGQFRARATERMPKRNRAAVDVHFRRIQTEFTHHGERLNGEGFVQFDEIYIL